MRPEVRSRVLNAVLRGLDDGTAERRCEDAMGLAEEIAQERYALLLARADAEGRYAAELADIEQRRGLLQSRCPHWSISPRLGGLACDLCGASLPREPN